MGAVVDIWKSERGLVGIVLILSCTVLAALGRITSDQWLEYTKWIFAFYVGSKTVTGAFAILKNATPDVSDKRASPEDVRLP